MEQNDHNQVLLGLAWLGEMTTDHVQRVRFPTDGHTSQAWATRQARRVLRALYAARLVDKRPSSTGARQHVPPRWQGWVWSLTQDGWARIRKDEAAPLQRASASTMRPRPYMVRMTDVIVTMIERARSVGLSGISIKHDVRLEPNQPRPVVDAVVKLRLGKASVPNNTVPWTVYGAMTTEGERRFAVLLDDGTNAQSVLGAKARAYARITTPEWVALHGKVPAPLWIVPDKQRRDAIMMAWAAAWPDGYCMVTTDEDLQRDCWVEFADGTVTPQVRPLLRPQPPVAELPVLPSG